MSVSEEVSRSSTLGGAATLRPAGQPSGGRHRPGATHPTPFPGACRDGRAMWGPNSLSHDSQGSGDLWVWAGAIAGYPDQVALVWIGTDPSFPDRGA
jgi:hypothetical protein